MRMTLIAAVALAAPISLVSAPIQQGRAGASDCVTIGIPKPTASYVIQHSESTGKSTLGIELNAGIMNCAARQ